MKITQDKSKIQGPQKIGVLKTQPILKTYKYWLPVRKLTHDTVQWIFTRRCWIHNKYGKPKVRSERLDISTYRGWFNTFIFQITCPRRTSFYGLHRYLRKNCDKVWFSIDGTFQDPAQPIWPEAHTLTDGPTFSLPFSAMACLVLLMMRQKNTPSNEASILPL